MSNKGESMNQLLAKVKNRAKNISEAFKKVISDESIYITPYNLTDCVDYNPNTLLENGQWYKISEFSEQDFCIYILKEESFDSVDFDMLEKEDFTKIDYLCSCEGDVFYFQKIRPTQLVVKKRIIFGERYKYDANSKSVVINSFPDAIYSKNDDTLYFQRLEPIVTIFRGIDVLYKEATEQETDTFLHNDFISLANGFNATKVNKSVRKKIALATDSLDALDDEKKQEMIQYIQANAGLNFENNSFVISNEDDLKKLLYGISERYYEAPVSRQRRIANSIINITTN